MWLLILTKYWKYGIMAILSIALLTTVTIYKHQVRTLGLELTAINAEYDLQQSRFLDTIEMVKNQNIMIQNLRDTAAAQEKALQEALAKPPRIIYRDRIVEVPSILTGPCEQVVTDIANYVDGVMK